MSAKTGRTDAGALLQIPAPPTQVPTQAPIPVWGIHLREIRRPEGAKRIEWYLLTTQEVTSLD